MSLALAVRHIVVHSNRFSRVIFMYCKLGISQGNAWGKNGGGGGGGDGMGWRQS